MLKKSISPTNLRQRCKKKSSLEKWFTWMNHFKAYRFSFDGPGKSRRQKSQKKFLRPRFSGPVYDLSMNKFFACIISIVLISSPVSLANDQMASDKFAANPEAKKKSSMAQTLVVMSSSAFGASALVGCVGGGTIAGSSIAFSAGSFIYIMSEITAGKALRDSLKKRAKDLELVKEKMVGGGVVPLGAGDYRRLCDCRGNRNG